MLANRATEVVCWGVAIGTLGAFMAPASQPNPTLFAAAMGGVVIGGVASLLSIANIAGRNSEGTLEQSDDVWRAASQMVGEPIPSAMADRLRKRIKRG